MSKKILSFRISQYTSLTPQRPDRSKIRRETTIMREFENSGPIQGGAHASLHHFCY